MTSKTSQTHSRPPRRREISLSTLWGFVRILLWLIMWILSGVLIYAFLYVLLTHLSGEYISLQELANRLRNALAGEAGKESTAVLVALLTGLLGFAAQQWRYRAEIELKRIEQEREERRRRAFEEIDRLRDALQKSECAASLSLYRLFRKQCTGPWRDIGVEDHLHTIWAREAPPSLRAWIELSEKEEKPETKPAPKLGDIEAIIWGWRLDRERREQAYALLKEVFAPQRLKELVELFKIGDYKLLRSGIVGQRLEELSNEVSEEQREFLQTLQQWRERPVPLSPPWSATCPSESGDFVSWLKQSGFSANPFGPALAESDPFLASYGVWPLALERARGPRPALVFGAPGSGRTAAALLLFYKCTHPPVNPEEGNIFPIWLEMDYWPETSEAWLEVLGRAVARALLQVYKQDPYTLFEDPNGASIAQLFSCCLRPGPLETNFRRAGIAGETLDYLLGEIEAHTGTVFAETTDPTILRDLIGWARPGDLHSTYIIVDVPNLHHSVDRAHRNYSLALLMELAGPLMSRNVYLKLFLPDMVQHHLQPCWPLESLRLHWTEEDLRVMLERRLLTASEGKIESLSAICSERKYPPDPDTWLVQLVKGLPRRLVELGNQMLREAWQQAVHSERI